MTMPDPVVALLYCQTCGTRVQGIAWREPDDDTAVAKPCGHELRRLADVGVVVVQRPACRHCHRTIEWVDGVGWIHVDTRVYFVPGIEPKCDAAEPEDTPPVRPRD
jgi:hypothetical protein